MMNSKKRQCLISRSTSTLACMVFHIESFTFVPTSTFEFNTKEETKQP